MVLGKIRVLGNVYAKGSEKGSVPLSATLDGKPDWVYMESYMKGIKDESRKRIKCLKMDLEYEKKL